MVASGATINIMNGSGRTVADKQIEGPTSTMTKMNEAPKHDREIGEAPKTAL
jgi:hypothetical protein